MKKMIYTSPRGKEVVFDDFCKEKSDNSLHSEESVWCEMCSHCHNRFKNILKGRFDEKGTAQGTCSVEGCNNEADYYVDFQTTECSFE